MECRYQRCGLSVSVGIMWAGFRVCDILHNCINSLPFVVKAASRRADLPACGGEITTAFRARCTIAFPRKREPQLQLLLMKTVLSQQHLSKLGLRFASRCSSCPQFNNPLPLQTASN